MGIRKVGVHLTQNQNLKRKSTEQNQKDLTSYDLQNNRE